MAADDVVIYGGGGFAREVAWLVNSLKEDCKKVVCFVDDDKERHGLFLNDIPILNLEEAWASFPNARIVGGIGSPGTRELVMNKAKELGFDFLSLIHPNVEMSKWVEIGDGVVICAGNILTTNITLHDHVQINLDCTIGHDVIMGKYATLAPGVHLSGNVHLGKRVYIGTGAIVINGTKENPIIIDDDAVVGAGACVIKNVPSGDTVVGIPAKSIKGR